MMKNRSRSLRATVLLLASLPLSVPLRANPLPEVEQSHLVVHDLARDFLPTDILRRAEIRGDGGSPRGYAEPNLIWVRDRYPLQARDSQGRPVVIPYLNLLHPGGVTSDGSTWAPVSPPAGYPAGSLAFRSGDRLHWMEVRPLPLMIEGGNVIALGEYLLIGEKILHENARTPQEILERHGKGDRRPAVAAQVRACVEAGYRARSREEVLETLAKAFEMPVEKIRVLPWMPGERTGHIDMYLGALDGRTLVVPEIDAGLLEELDYEHERTYARRMTAWLEDRVGELEAFFGGAVRVRRVPMIPPKNLVTSSLSEFGWDAQFPTPVNWLLIEGQAYVPSFPEFLQGVPPEKVVRFRQSLEETLAEHGLHTEWVPAHRMLPTHGLIHCMTHRMRLPD